MYQLTLIDSFVEMIFSRPLRRGPGFVAREISLCSVLKPHTRVVINSRRLRTIPALSGFPYL